MNKCELCKYWDRKSDTVLLGYCKRYAPYPSSHGSSFWIQTSCEDWCGEFGMGEELQITMLEKLTKQNEVLMKVYEAFEALEAANFEIWDNKLLQLRTEFRRAKKVLEEST